MFQLEFDPTNVTISLIEDDIPEQCRDPLTGLIADKQYTQPVELSPFLQMTTFEKAPDKWC